MSSTPNRTEEFDALIIGAGQAGIPLAHALAKKGRSVALAERKHLGGSCVNFGCIPTKAAIASARVAHQARRGGEYGLKIPTVDVDFPAVLQRAKQIVLASQTSLRKRLDASENPKLIYGHARLDGRDGDLFRVHVGELTVRAKQIVLDTGTRSLIPPVPGLGEIEFIHAGNWLEHSTLPEHLAVIGGGYIALEMSQFYRRLGSRVTVIEQSEQIAAHEDADVAVELQKLLEEEGIVFHLSTEVVSIQTSAGGVRVSLKSDGGMEEFAASHVFVATGRLPNTDDLGLDSVGVKVSKRGIVGVDRRLATDVPGIWAAGDIRGGPMFTHTSWDDYRILLSQMAGDGSRTTERVIPYGVFTDPELGRVGMTENEARKAGNKVKTARFDINRNGKAKEIGETAGFIKVVIDEETKLLLGAAVLASEGAELVHMYIDLMNAKAPYTVIRDAVHIHPTLAEAVQSAVSELDKV